MRRILPLILVLLAMPLMASGQAWRIFTPSETHPIPANTGERVDFPQVVMPGGYQYRVRGSNSLSPGNNSDIVDARYYISNGVQLAPSFLLPVGLKIRYDGVREDWFNSAIAPAIQGGYQPNHQYDAVVNSRGVALQFRFFDRNEPPHPDYGNNSGFIDIEVARETPGIAIKDTILDFGDVSFGNFKGMLDSMQSYGYGRLKVDSVSYTGSTAFTFSTERGNQFTMDKDETTEFRISFAPRQMGPHRGEITIYSSNAGGEDRVRVIHLKGVGHGALIRASPDTLNFGVVKLNGNAVLSEGFINAGDSPVVLLSATITTPGTDFSISGFPVNLPPSKITDLPVRFNPQRVGKQFAAVEVSLSDGRKLTFYLSGRCGLGLAKFTRDTLDFGTLFLQDKRTLRDTMTNVGIAELDVISVSNSNPTDFKVIGNQSSFSLATSGSAEIYTITFSPQAYAPNNLHTSLLTFSFIDGSTKEVVLVGRDRLPLNAIFSINRNYFAQAGKRVMIAQMLNSDLSSVFYPVRRITEHIGFNTTLLKLDSIAPGKALNEPKWDVTWNVVSDGVDLTLFSAADSVGAPGQLLRLYFTVSSLATPEDSSLFPQTNIVFESTREPLGASSEGLLKLGDACGPVPLVTDAGKNATRISMSSSYPNPTQGWSEISYSVPTELPLRISLFDRLGNRVGLPVDRNVEAGTHVLRLDAAALPNGIYTYILESGETRIQKRLVVAK